MAALTKRQVHRDEGENEQRRGFKTKHPNIINNGIAGTMPFCGAL
jgi:hypothetical protein